jgi:hypothetical protein
MIIKITDKWYINCRVCSFNFILKINDIISFIRLSKSVQNIKIDISYILSQNENRITLFIFIF